MRPNPTTTANAIGIALRILPEHPRCSAERMQVDKGQRSRRLSEDTDLFVVLPVYRGSRDAAATTNARTTHLAVTAGYSYRSSRDSRGIPASTRRYICDRIQGFVATWNAGNSNYCR